MIYPLLVLQLWMQIYREVSSSSANGKHMPRKMGWTCLSTGKNRRLHVLAACIKQESWDQEVKLGKNRHRRCQSPPAGVFFDRRPRGTSICKWSCEPIGWAGGQNALLTNVDHGNAITILLSGWAWGSTSRQDGYS